MDLSSQQSILGGVDAFRAAGHDRLNVLIHNAADFDVARKIPAYSADGIETVWATNHIGPVLLTQQLEPELLRSQQARVVTVSPQGLVLHPRWQQYQVATSITGSGACRLAGTPKHLRTCER